MRKLPLAALLLLALALPPLSDAQSACQAPASREFPDEGGPHATQCSELSYSHYPPTSGRHFSTWAPFRKFEFIMNAGNWLHSMEHGAVVFLVNCGLPGDCKSDFAKVQALADAMPTDPLCDSATRHRIVISGDSLIPTRFAAVAWNWSLLSDCLDTAAFGAFYRTHSAKAPENFCNPGDTTLTEKGGCNAPLPILPLRIEARRNISGPWAGTLAARGRLIAELRSLKGAHLAEVDLGYAGPGPARVDWDAHLAGLVAGQGPAVLRIRFESPAGSAILGETFLRP